MLRKISYSIFLVAFLAFCSGFKAHAQEAHSGFSPYSIYGLGDMATAGSAYNKSMAGVGIANRTNRYVNIINPASITERDSLSFMADFSLYNDNKYFKQNGISSVNNVFNIGDFVISFPLWKHTAMMMGITPYSNTGFDYSIRYTDPNVIGNIGNVNFSAKGNGSIYKTFVAGAVEFFDRVSVGAEFDYYFGNLQKSFQTTISDASYNSIDNGTSLQARAVGATFGIQYEQPIGTKVKLGLGATYSTGAEVKGFYEDYKMSSVDTLYSRKDTLGVGSGVKLAAEMGIGLSFKYADKLMVEFDYTRSDWSGSGVNKISGFSTNSSPFASTMSEAYRLGFEIVPNRNDIRYYFNRVAYRGGVFYKKDNILLNGSQIFSAGLTMGATFPIYSQNARYSRNGLTVGVELGQRGSLADGLVRERFVNFTVGINLYDIWFLKYQYD